MSKSVEAIDFRNAIYEQFARIGKAVSSPKRLEILDLLSQGPRTVEVLAKGTGQSIANTSQHLQLLLSARLVEKDKKGLYAYYRLADEAVGDFYRSLRKLAEIRLAEIEQFTRNFLNQNGLEEQADNDDLVEKIRSGEAIVLDLRSPDEYQKDHIPGAVSVPSRELEERLKDLPRDKDLIAYCRGPYCVVGIKAVSKLRAKGFKAYRLPLGVAEWKAKGMETTSGNSYVE
jgi:rhodanese-related sulfurtransferase/DNA-binding transcriptional ArsR family regulator